MIDHPITTDTPGRNFDMLNDDLISVAWTAACIALSLYAFHRRDVRSGSAAH